MVDPPSLLGVKGLLKNVRIRNFLTSGSKPSPYDFLSGPGHAPPDDPQESVVRVWWRWGTAAMYHE